MIERSLATSGDLDIRGPIGGVPDARRYIETLRILDIEGGKRANGKQDVEFQSRCGRLGGFGPAVSEVESPYGGSDQLYTAIPRGQWLISALGEKTT